MLDEKPSDKVVAGCGLGCGGLVVVVGIIWVFSSIFGKGDTGDDDGGGEYGARDVCHQFVKERLKSPGSADFSGESAVENGDESWTVRGNVDSDNSFGAAIRNTYTCKVKHTSGENWTLISMQATEN